MVGRLIALAIVGFLAVIIIAISSSPGVIAEPPPGGCVITPDVAASPVGNGTTSTTQKTAELDAAQMAAARTIAAVGKNQGIAERGIAIALGTAMQESTLNPAAVNGRSVGLFQQQGQLYAGVDRTDPAAASAAFYRILTARVPTYAQATSGTYADIAQEVQRSGAGATKYAPWENWATALAAQLVAGPTTPIGPGLTPTSELEQPVVCEPGGGPGPIEVQKLLARVKLPARAGIAAELTFPNLAAATAAAAALSYLGTPYSWGGGGPDGPTKGIRDGGVADSHGDYTKVGFDCSGLTEYAYAQAGIPIGGDSRTQRAVGGAAHAYRDALPGDLLFWGRPTQNNIHHVALYLGIIDGTAYMIEAPQSGDVVKISPVRTSGDFRHEAIRPWH